MTITSTRTITGRTEIITASIRITTIISNYTKGTKNPKTKISINTTRTQIQIQQEKYQITQREKKYSNNSVR